MGKSKEKRAEKFSQVIIEPMLNNEMTFNEAFEFMLNTGHRHWKGFANARRDTPSSVRLSKTDTNASNIVFAIEILKGELAKWNYAKDHRHFDHNANEKA